VGYAADATMASSIISVLKPTCRLGFSGGQPFNEGASQVKRLINRDRKEFLGNEGDILDKFETEFGDKITPESKAEAGEYRYTDKMAM
jgi:hypothetical protein